jgi:ubiquinone/menaquinone biosynthesis C-methylase UbiE
MPEALSEDQIREKVRKEWTADETAAAWRKWHHKLTGQTQEATDAIVNAAHVAPGMRVLDIACGSGEPSLTLAERVGPTGHVTATDFSAGMLSVAEANARQRGLKNITFRTADADDLKFPTETFDRVTCRFGAMFFPDVNKAFREIRRVLRPGGRTALLAWGPFEQPFFGLTAGVIMKYARPPPQPPGSPKVDRFAPQGTLKAALNDSGFREVNEEHLALRGVWAGPPEELWTAFSEIAAPFRSMISNLGPAEREQAIGEVLAGLRSHYDGNVVAFPLLVVVGTGVR